MVVVVCTLFVVVVVVSDADIGADVVIVAGKSCGWLVWKKQGKKRVDCFEGKNLIWEEDEKVEERGGEEKRRQEEVCLFGCCHHQF